MNNPRRVAAGLAVALLGAAGLSSLQPLPTHSPPDHEGQRAQASANAPTSSPSAPAAAGTMGDGPARSSAAPAPIGAPIRVRDPAAQAAANARSVVEAAKTGRFPERLNPLVAPKPFDRASFEKDPLAYLDVIEPGRVFQSAEGGPGVKTLEAEGPPHLETEPQGSVRLSVVGEPRSPVTFTSFDRGAFDNGLCSITVLADPAGEASVRFTATVGTIDDVNILSASPLAAGQVAFLVTVKRD